jgi:two-component system chemotaxis sensor kinase CheA
VDLSRYAALFLADGRDHLRRCSAELLRWEERPGDLGPVDELFRAFHSLKGSAATMEYQGVVAVTHSAEQLLDAVRGRRLSPSRAVIGLLFQAVDLLERGLEMSVRGEPLPEADLLAEAVGRMIDSAPPSLPQPEAVPVVSSQPEAPTTERRVGRARVDPARLDEVLLHAGELIVARNQLAEVTRGRSDPELDAVVGRIDTLTRRLHAGVIKVRLAPIAELFGRFPRIVRDLALSLGKAARLELSGEGIELDRAVIEELVDPLIHLVRNAVDHGIEPATVRAGRGKPAEGRLVLMAERRRDLVAIRLSDDGAGIDPQRVARRAVELGLLPAGSGSLSSDTLLSLLSRPGFTLKDAVTEVSGRGVGMDVVVSKVRALGGQVELRTQLGWGSEFEISVSLTTAVQRVLLVTANGERFAVPFRLVREAVMSGRSDDARVSGNGEFSFRGRSLPYVELAGAAGGRPEPPTARRPVLMLEWGARSGALGVDSLLGQHDVLLERIEAPATLPSWVSGATILGDGSPAFVLDPTALF